LRLAHAKLALDIACRLARCAHSKRFRLRSRSHGGRMTSQFIA
jgi:hypothetical protein